MVVLFGGLSRRGHGGNRSSAPDPPNGIASLVLDTIETGTTWVLAVDQPRRPSYWTHGTQEDSGPHQKTFLVVWSMEQHRRTRAILSGLPIGEIRPQEKVGICARGYAPQRTLALEDPRATYVRGDPPFVA